MSHLNCGLKGKLGGCALIMHFASLVANAQSFNMSFGADTFSKPSASYGAAAGQNGFWNRGGGHVSPVYGLDGVTQIARTTASAFDVSYRDVAGAVGDDERLMETAFVAYQNGASMWFNDLDPGTYELFLYGWGSPWMDGSGEGVADFDITVSGTGSGVFRLDFASKTWPGGHVKNETYLQIPITLKADLQGKTFFNLDMTGNGHGFQIIQGMQLVMIPTPTGVVAFTVAACFVGTRRRR